MQDDAGRFEVSARNPPFDLLEPNVESAPHALVSFLTSSVPTFDEETDAVKNVKKSAGLIAGAAGSGKSTFLVKLLQYLRTEYRQWRVEQRPELKLVLIVLVRLGGLHNPMTDLWAEGLKKQYRLTQAQCDELREKVRLGQVEVLFLLDAYDELSTACIGKSLFQANNLEQYRSDDEREAVSDRAHIFIPHAAASLSLSHTNTHIPARPSLSLSLSRLSLSLSLAPLGPSPAPVLDAREQSPSRALPRHYRSSSPPLPRRVTTPTP